jgi:ribonuclease D
LRAVRDRLAETVGIEAGLLCPTASLKAIARERPRTIADLESAGLRRWQAEEVGPELLAVLHDAAQL